MYLFFYSSLVVNNGRSRRSFVVVAYWYAQDGKIEDFDDIEIDSSTGQI